MTPDERILNCGCIICICMDEEQCHGCGSRVCDEHSPSKQKKRLEAYLIERDERESWRRDYRHEVCHCGNSNKQNSWDHANNCLYRLVPPTGG